MYLISWLFFLVWNPELSIEVLSFGQKEATPIFLLNPWWGIYAHNNLVHPEDEYQIPGTNQSYNLQYYQMVQLLSIMMWIAEIQI